MKYQTPDILINESDVDLKGFAPECINDADDRPWNMCLPVAPEVPHCSHAECIRHASLGVTLRLRTDGQLELVQFEFSRFCKIPPPQVCNALFQGDFQLALAPFYRGPKMIVPFREGAIVRNQDEWTIEDQTLTAVVLRPSIEKETDRIFGLLVDIEFGFGSSLAFAPRSAIAEDLRADPLALVGKHVSCTILLVDRERNDNIVVRIESLEGDPTDGRHE